MFNLFCFRSLACVNGQQCTQKKKKWQQSFMWKEITENNQLVLTDLYFAHNSNELTCVSVKQMMNYLYCTWIQIKIQAEFLNLGFFFLIFPIIVTAGKFVRFANDNLLFNKSSLCWPKQRKVFRQAIDESKNQKKKSRKTREKVKKNVYFFHLFDRASTKNVSSVENARNA